ncbi:MAG: RHS repeat-associated core domain-containing protein, partial [Bacteroidota bacterium]
LATNKSWRLKGYLDPWQLYQAGHANFDTLTGNYDFLYRSYDPVLGQFTAADPLAVVTPGHSPYHANYNNPVMFTDPLGLCPECPRDKRYYDARDNFMDYEPTSYVSPNLNGNSWVHSIGRNSRVYERYQMWSDARTLGLDEYVQKYGETYTNMNAYWRYYEEEQMLNGVQVKRPELIISGGVNDGYQASGGGLPIGDGGFLFRNENEAFAYMYSTSLNNSSGEIRELSGWITTMGILVMPYNRNTAYVSRNDYYKIRRSSDSSLAVEFGGIFAPEILGHIHTHPHAHDKGPTLPYFQRGFGRSEGDFAMYDLISSPIFTIGPNNITMGYRDANDQPQRSVVGSRNDGIFIGSIYKWLN